MTAIWKNVTDYTVDNIDIDLAEVNLIYEPDSYVRANLYHIVGNDSEGQEILQQLAYSRYFYFQGANKNIPFSDLTQEEINQLMEF
jgi:hypothetical protein